MRLRTTVILTICLLAAPGAAAGRIIETVVGTNVSNVDATSIGIADPYSIALDLQGNVYVGTDRTQVYRIDPNGILTVVAGNFVAGFVEDGVPAIDTPIGFPYGLAIDPAGNVVLGESHARIRRIDSATGIISTIAGTGVYGFSGDGGPATEARIDVPRGLIIDPAGNLYFAESGNCRVRRIDGATGVITTVAGDGAVSSEGDGGLAVDASLNRPSAIALDDQGDLFILERIGRRVRRVDHTTGIISSIVTGLTNPGGLCSHEGILWVSDQRFVEAYDSETGIQTLGFNVQGGTSSALSAVAVDLAGNVLIADPSQRIVHRWDVLTHEISDFAGNYTDGYNGDDIPPLEASLSGPWGVAVDSHGAPFFTSEVVQTIDPVYGTLENIRGPIGTPAGLTIDAQDNVYFVDSERHCVFRWNESMYSAEPFVSECHLGFGFGGDGGPAIDALLDAPLDVALDTSGNMFIGEIYNARVRRVDALTGVITTFAGDGRSMSAGDGGLAVEASLYSPFGLTLDADDNLYISDNARIRRVDRVSGIIDSVVGNGVSDFKGDGGPADEASLGAVVGISFDDEGNLWIADYGSHRLRRVVTVNDAPVAVAGDDQRLECAGPGGTAVMLDGSASFDPEGEPLTFTWTGSFPEGGGTVTGPTPVVTLKLGAWTIELVVSDGEIESAADTVVVRVVDTSPPGLQLAASPTTLWPPNGRWVDVHVTPAASDFCGDVTVILDSITSSADDGSEDVRDADLGTDDRDFQLRARRLGWATGTSYEVTYSAVDSVGNRTTAMATVAVPHDRRSGNRRADEDPVAAADASRRTPRE